MSKVIPCKYFCGNADCYYGKCVAADCGDETLRPRLRDAEPSELGDIKRRLDTFIAELKQDQQDDVCDTSYEGKAKVLNWLLHRLEMIRNGV